MNRFQVTDILEKPPVRRDLQKLILFTRPKATTLAPFDFNNSDSIRYKIKEQPENAEKILITLTEQCIKIIKETDLLSFRDKKCLLEKLDFSLINQNRKLTLVTTPGPLLLVTVMQIILIENLSDSFIFLESAAFCFLLVFEFFLLCKLLNSCYTKNLSTAINSGDFVSWINEIAQEIERIDNTASSINTQVAVPDNQILVIDEEMCMDEMQLLQLQPRSNGYRLTPV